MKKDAIVLYPSPGMGHLVSMVELGKLILTHHPLFSITILITTPPYNTGSTAPYINRVSTNNPSITFHRLPIISLPLDTVESHYKEAFIFELLRLNNPNVQQALQAISQTSNVKVLILDFFCFAALDVAATLNIPAYFFFTSPASVLCVFLYLSTIHKTTTKSFKDIDTHINIPGLPPILASDMVKAMQDRNDLAYKGFLDVATHMPKSFGIIVNTFESLEQRGIKALRDGLCVTDASTPPIYSIGPLIATDDQTGGGGGGTAECLTWLDSQPSGSVVFLCFGSLGLFSAAQLKEIAVGLEKSGQRFLWVVRSPPITEEQNKRMVAPPDPDLDALLPEGFMERTRERGLVVKSWAPQVEVLSRESVGGFVTHCGWNSVLEAICAGVPMVAWPLYAEQRMNRVILVEEMKLALSMDESKDGFVTANEVEKRVSELMDSEEGKELRERTLAMRDASKDAMGEGGSSRVALDKLAVMWKQ